MGAVGEGDGSGSEVCVGGGEVEVAVGGSVLVGGMGVGSERGDGVGDALADGAVALGVGDGGLEGVGVAVSSRPPAEPMH